MIKNFAQVTDSIYRGGDLDLNGLSSLDKIYGIKRIISLDTSVAHKISNWLKQYNTSKIEHLIIPINPSLPKFDDSLKYLVKNISLLLTQKQPVFIHCLQGQDRTGLAIAMFRIKKQGWSLNAALNEAKKFGFGNGITIDVRKFFNNILITLSSKGDINAIIDGDAVSKSRESISQITAPIIIPQQSFAPFTPDVMPNDNINRKNLYQNLLNSLEEDKVSFPNVGVRVQSTPLRGAGPVENSGISEMGMNYESI